MGGIPGVSQIGDAVSSVTDNLGPVGDMISGALNPTAMLAKLGLNPMDMISGMLPEGITGLLQNPLVQMAISAAFPGVGSAAMGMLGGGGLSVGGFAGGSLDLGSVADLV